MADVISRSADGRDKGQMLLVAAFGVAVMLVALALILNTSIYTENIATRGSDISGGKDALRFRAVTEDSFRGTIRYVNEHNNSTGNYDDMVDNTKHAVWNYSNMTGPQQAGDSIVVNVSLRPHAPSKGVRVFENGDENFTNEDDVANWTVVEDTDGVRDFSLDVPRSKLENESPRAGPGDRVFFINMTNGSSYYNIFIYNNSDVNPGGNLNDAQFMVAVHDETGFLGSCGNNYGSDGRAQINLTNASAEGNSCGALEDWTPILDDSFTMHFNNTRDPGGTEGNREYNIRGEYSMILNSTYADANVQDGDPGPTKGRVIYSTIVHLTYESKRLYMETDVRVAPGEPDG